VLDVALMWKSLPALLGGVWLTVQLSVCTLLLGLAVAIPVSLARNSRRPWLHLPANAYILFFRGTPALVQIALLYYGAGQFESVRQSPAWVVLREPFWCAVIALGLNSGAYTGQNLSGALRAVPKGVMEAGRALGLRPGPLFLTIQLPLAVRIALPAYGNEVILTMKATSLASAITLVELTGRARAIVADTYAPYEIFVMAGLVYLAMTWLISTTFAFVEKRLQHA
jgi:His/Glu/Gln/Arg/opine family amino acid ABC transporter permease subunit